MNDRLVDGNNINLNVSGFYDDSMISDADDNRDEKNNFLLKSMTAKSLGNSMNKPIINQKNSIPNNDSPGINNPDGIITNAKNRNFTEVMMEDLFSNLYAIPLNRPSKFSTSRMGHKFTYESNSKITSYKIDNIKFGLSKNSEIITYLISLFIFSEFLNLEELEKDKRFKVMFIKQNKIQKQFIIDDKKSLLNSLEIPNDKSNDFDMFLNGINDFLKEDEYINLQKKNKKKMISVYALIILIIVLILGIITAIYFTISTLTKKDENKTSKIITLILLFMLIMIFGFGLVMKIIDANNLKLLFIYYDLRYLLINYNKINEHIEEWNKNLFEEYKIRVSMPISLNYIMFNLNPYQNIEIKHLDMDWLKKKFYKSQNDIFKSGKDKQLFNLIKQNVFQDKERLSLSIN
jgi:hypothetical protein